MITFFSKDRLYADATVHNVTLDIAFNRPSKEIGWSHSGNLESDLVIIRQFREEFEYL